LVERKSFGRDRDRGWHGDCDSRRRQRPGIEASSWFGGRRAVAVCFWHKVSPFTWLKSRDYLVPDNAIVAAWPAALVNTIDESPFGTLPAKALSTTGIDTVELWSEVTVTDEFPFGTMPNTKLPLTEEYV
jgi:hypothetical protein